MYILITVPRVFKNKKYTLMLSCLLQEDTVKRDLLHLYLNGFNRRLNLQLRILFRVRMRFKALSERDVKLYVDSLILISFFPHYYRRLIMKTLATFEIFSVNAHFVFSALCIVYNILLFQ